MESRAAWTAMAAMKEFAARRPAVRGPGGSPAEFAADELHLTPLSAAEQIDFACTAAKRLPQTFAALGAGRIHPVHLRIIEDETRFLTEEDAAKADRILADAAAGLMFGETRHAAHKLVLSLDPEAAKKRKEAARGEVHVRRFREDSGNAGMPGTLTELRVRAYLDLLQERDSRELPVGSGSAPGQPPPGSGPPWALAPP
jgi:hypothetical protein